MKYLPVILFLLILISGCVLEEEKCYELIPTDAYSAEGPDSAGVNETVIISVSFPCWNGCGHYGTFDMIDETSNSKTIQVKAEYTGCVCTMVASTQIAEYYFNETIPGNYVINFVSGDSLISHQIIVN